MINSTTLVQKKSDWLPELTTFNVTMNFVSGIAIFNQLIMIIMLSQSDGLFGTEVGCVF